MRIYPYFQRGATGFQNPNAATSSLPTFLVGLGRPAAEDGLAVETAMEVTASNSEYHSYLIDARKAVRDRFEATQCWQYDYDGIHPSPASIASTASPPGGQPNNNKACDIPQPPNFEAGATSAAGTPSASGPTSLTEATSGSGLDEDDKVFWTLMKADESNHKAHNAIKRLRTGDDLSLSSGGNLSWTSSGGELGSPRGDDVDHSYNTLGN